MSALPLPTRIGRHALKAAVERILTLGEADSDSPYLQVEIYRPGSEIRDFDDPKAQMIASARARAD